MSTIDTPEKWQNYILDQGLKEYSCLYQEELKYTLFKEHNNIDHRHCDLCWDKFSEKEDDLHYGYASVDNQYWICPDCFYNFKNLFHWTLIDDEIK